MFGFFFFQAEDGIRDGRVTGVQTCALPISGVAAFAQNPKVINDPNAQKRTASGFHGVQIGGGIDLYLSQGADEAVAVSASSPEYRDRIVTEVQDGILHIYIDDKWHWSW